MDRYLAQFLVSLILFVCLYKPFNLDQAKPLYKSQSELSKHYTFIIVGAGSAGILRHFNYSNLTFIVIKNKFLLQVAFSLTD